MGIHNLQTINESLQNAPCPDESFGNAFFNQQNRLEKSRIEVEDIKQPQAAISAIVKDVRVQKSIKNFLLPKYNVTVYSCFEEAMTSLIAGEISDLILLDPLSQPVSGLGMCETLKSLKATTEQPILLLSPPQNYQLTQLIGNLANDYVSKPIRENELLTRIKLQLELHELQKNQPALPQSHIESQTVVRSNHWRPQPSINTNQEVKQIAPPPLSRSTKSSEATIPQQNEHELLVRILNLSLQYWQRTTQKSKRALIEESGIWKGFVDKCGTYRSRTFDRYLNKRSLPKKPREL